jgi:hypothetical protein
MTSTDADSRHGAGGGGGGLSAVPLGGPPLVDNRGKAAALPSTNKHDTGVRHPRRPRSWGHVGGCHACSGRCCVVTAAAPARVLTNRWLLEAAVTFRGLGSDDCLPRPREAARPRTVTVTVTFNCLVLIPSKG